MNLAVKGLTSIGCCACQVPKLHTVVDVHNTMHHGPHAGLGSLVQSHEYVFPMKMNIPVSMNRTYYLITMISQLH